MYGAHLLEPLDMFAEVHEALSPPNYKTKSPDEHDPSGNSLLQETIAKGRKRFSEIIPVPLPEAGRTVHDGGDPPSPPQGWRAFEPFKAHAKERSWLGEWSA